MSSETRPVLRYVELPLAPGARITVWCPPGGGPFGAEPFLDGQGFTIDANGDRWRAILRYVKAGAVGITLDLEIEGRYPATARTAIE